MRAVEMVYMWNGIKQILEKEIPALSEYETTDITSKIGNFVTDFLETTRRLKASK